MPRAAMLDEQCDMQNLSSNIFVKAGLIVGVSLILGLLFDYFFFGKIPGLAFPLYVVLMVLGLFFLAWVFKKKIDREVYWLLLPLFFFSVMVFVRSSVLLTVLNIVASLLLLLMITEVFVGKRVRNFLVGDYIKIFFQPFKFILPLFQTLFNFFSLRGVIKNQKVSSQVVRGILMAVPVLLVFLLLFSSADLIFHKYVLDLLSFNIEDRTVCRLIFVLIVTGVCVGAYTYLFQEKENQNGESLKGKNYNLGHVENSILLGSVNVLFFIFIFIQLTYLFGGEGNISAQGFTYAEYARRGFFELIAVAIISLLLLLVVEKCIAKKEMDHALGFKILSTILVVQVVLIMISAFARLMLYEEAYGFTTLRLYSHAFIILLAAVFCLLLYKIYKDKRENAFAFRVFILIILFLAVMNFLNPDSFIARRNLERFVVSGKLDFHYLRYHLSDDAMSEIITALDMPDEAIIDTDRLSSRENFVRHLYWRVQRGDSPYFSKWQSLNISRLRANKILNSRIHELEQYKNYQF